MQKFIKLLLAVCLLSPTYSFAAKVFVSQTNGVVSPEDANSVRELVKMAVNGTSGFSTVESPSSADLQLQPKVLKLGNSYIMNLSKADKAGKVLFEDKMKASEMADMDRVAARLVKSVLTEQPAPSTADVTNITDEEVNQNTRRIEATRQWIFGIGPGWARNLTSKGGGFSLTLGYLWGLDPDWAINLSWLINSGRGSDDSSFSAFNLGMEHYLTQEKTSPFFGAGIGYASAKPNGNCTISFFGSCDSSKATGWSLNGSAGVKFFRTSSVNLGLLGSYHFVLDKIGNRRPSLFATQVVVYF